MSSENSLIESAVQACRHFQAHRMLWDRTTQKWWALKDLNLRPIDYESSHYPFHSMGYLVLFCKVSLIVCFSLLKFIQNFWPHLDFTLSGGGSRFSYSLHKPASEGDEDQESNHICHPFRAQPIQPDSHRPCAKNECGAGDSNAQQSLATHKARAK